MLCVGLLVLATWLIGCASKPQPRALATGESIEDVANLANKFVLEYVFVVEGHRYALAKANLWAWLDTMFIDDKLACPPIRSPSPGNDDRWLSEIVPWQWVSRPDGLGYVADRLRETCGLDYAIPRREWPIGSGVPDLYVPTKEEDRAESKGYGLGRIVGGPDTLILVALWPLVVAGWLYEGGVTATTGAAEKRHARIDLLMSQDEIAKVLGGPQVTFSLPDASSRVYAYEVETSHSFYIGFVDDRAVWIHTKHPWLRKLAREAIKESEHK